MNKLQRKQLEQHIGNLRYADKNLAEAKEFHEARCIAREGVRECYYELMQFLDEFTHEH